MGLLHLNDVLSIAIISWFAAQVAKTILYWIKTKRLVLERLTGAGGMPSCHSATVCALTIAVSRVDGIASTEFALALILAMVVMYDAMGVRRAAGLHAKELNRIRKILEEHYGDEADEDEGENGEIEKTKDLKEFLGHTPFEVLGGALLGILIAMAYPIPH